MKSRNNVVIFYVLVYHSKFFCVLAERMRLLLANEMIL
jgi:hypothetical protein